MYELSLSTGLTTEIGTVDRIAGVLRDHLPAAVVDDAVHWTVRTPAGDVHSGHIGATSSQEWITAAVDEIAANLRRPPAGAPAADAAIARIHLAVDLDVNVVDWAQEYGLTGEQVPADAGRNLAERLQQHVAELAALLGTFTPGQITATHGGQR